MANKSTCTQEDVDKAWEYIYGGYAEEDEELPTVDGLALYLRRVRATPYNWAKQDTNPFKDDFEEIKDILKKVQHVKGLTKALRGEINPQIFKMMMYNHGYSEKQALDHTSSDASMTPKGIDASKLSTDALKELMEARASSEPE